MMNQIDEIENDIHNSQQEIANLKIKMVILLAELVQAYMVELGLEKGKTVVKQGGDRYVVNGIYCTESGIYGGGKWLTGYKIKKDGTTGVQLKTITSGWVIES